MSVTIRLARTGRKNLPAYKIVVSTTRDKRNGKFVDILGHYNPSENPVSFNIDKKKFEEWKKKGALTTKAVEDLVAGTYEYKMYDPHGKKAKKEEKGDESTEPEKEAVEEVKVEETEKTEETAKETKEEDKKE